MMKMRQMVVFLSVLIVAHCGNTGLYDEAIAVYPRVVRPGLNEWFPLANSLVRRVGVSDATATGAFTGGTNRAGEAGKALCVNSVRLDLTSTNFGASPFSVSLWFKLNVVPASINTVWQKGTAMTFWNGLRFNQDNANSFIITYGNGASGSNLSHPSVAAATWYHMAFTYDGSAGTLYMAPYGGSLSKYGPTTGNYAQNAAALQINPGTLNMCVDDLLHYNRALHADEVQQNFESLE